MQISLNHLRIFYFAAKKKTLTKAAEALFVTQPAVTMQIKALEKHLEVPLFRKRGKFLELTDEGEVLYKYAEKIFGVVEEMEHALKGFASLTHGSLIIGTTRSFARHLMPGLISKYQEKFPGIKVSLEVGSSSEIAEGVANFRYDIGIIGRIPLPSKVKAFPYKPEEFCLVVSPNHRFAQRGFVSCRELKSEPIIIREPGSGSRHFMLSFLDSHGVKPSVLIEAGSVEFIKEYVIKGRGISFLYKPEVRLEANMGLLRPLELLEGPICIETIVVVPDGVTLSPRSRAFLGQVNALESYQHG
ncbi:MAG: LysR family transcriptional regulator [Deltaproteobacteria bacterium]|nr:LysR family transcriptional regulator [Deltaproteobacteria bacterium]